MLLDAILSKSGVSCWGEKFSLESEWQGTLALSPAEVGVALVLRGPKTLCLLACATSCEETSEVFAEVHPTLLVSLWLLVDMMEESATRGHRGLRDQNQLENFPMKFYLLPLHGNLK